jgi:NAD(P)-dependent dehydrogenase (short-subunit alcohol dehydrogenase family)
MELVASLRTVGHTAWAFTADLAEAAQAETLFEDVWETAGSIDYLVNSASIFPEAILDQLDLESLLPNLQINALAPFVLSRKLAARAGDGAVINLLDTRITDYDRAHVPYHLSKRMLYSLTRMMAVEYAPRLRVNAVAPGLVLPPVGEDEDYLAALASTNPLERYGSGEDVAEAVTFLLRSDFITGQTIFVDGGRHLRGSMYAY